MHERAEGRKKGRRKERETHYRPKRFLIFILSSRIMYQYDDVQYTNPATIICDFLKRDQLEISMPTSFSLHAGKNSARIRSRNADVRNYYNHTMQLHIVQFRVRFDLYFFF